MSQTSGGKSGRHVTSIAVTSTQNPAQAFGDDIGDDCYSVSELSHYDEDRLAKKHGRRQQQQPETFGRSSLPKLDRKESVQVDQIDVDQNGKDKNESSGSTEHSDEAAASSDSGEDSDLTITTFASFAQTRFQVRVPPTYSCSALAQPLLPVADKAEYLAALACWVCILRVMGDLPDEDGSSSLTVAGTGVPVTSRVKNGFKKKYTKKDIEEAHRIYTELFKEPVSTSLTSVPFVGERDVMLSKVQLVCAIGIYRPSLRDEIYCQVCKQLNHNPSNNSLTRGWVLLSLLATSFSPSERFAPCLTTFIQEGPREFAEKVDKTLRRTCAIGTRGYPPSWLEFQAAKNNKPLLVPVTLMNGHRLLCEVDSASTVLELIHHLSDRIGIKDISGYSIFVALQSQISCLGSGHHRVMDAISECEQHTRKLGMKENSALWRLFLRREYFCPGYTPGDDTVVSDLDFEQFKRGVPLGEYRFDKEDTVLSIAAKVFYATAPSDKELTKLGNFLHQFLPDRTEKKDNNLFEKVKSKIEELKLYTEKTNVGSVKTELVSFVMDKLPMMFSRHYDLSKITGPNLQLNEAVLAVNSKAVYIIDTTEKVRQQIDYSEVIDVVKYSRQHVGIKVSSLEEYIVTSSHSEDLHSILSSNLQHLGRISTLAIAVQDFSSIDGPTEDNVLKGDVLVLDYKPQTTSGSEVIQSIPAKNKRTNKKVEIPANLLHMIPVNGSPKEGVEDRISSLIKKDTSMLRSENPKGKSTLQQYAKIYFRPANESKVSKFLSKASIKKNNNDILWQYTKDYLKKPLLRRSCNREDVLKMATHCFTSIQTFCRNLVINDESTNYNLSTDWIIQPALRNKYLREEIFCQLIKQLTNNPDKSNENRVWILLALLTSVTLPSHELIDHVINFLKSSAHALANRCLENIRGKQRSGSCRLFPPHRLEHSMVLNNQQCVRVQLYLPNKTIQTLDIDSETKVLHMKKEVASRLKLTSFSEYSLFLTFKDKVHCLPDRAFYFDCLSQADLFWFKEKKRGSVTTLEPGKPILVMLKKIWVNGQPGINKAADEVFHFYQELPNFLRGYHCCSHDKLPVLAALAFKSQFGDDDEKNLGNLLSQVAPKNITQSHTIQDIQQAIQKQEQMTKEEARLAFLQEMSQFKTYGSVFFEVKQRMSSRIPKDCLIGINYEGVHVLDPTQQKLLSTHDFANIPNWASDEKSFTLILSGLGDNNKLLVETTVAHNMDDVIMSYVAWIMNFHMRRKHGYVGIATGESIC